jgi:hypothetical protein
MELHKKPEQLWELISAYTRRHSCRESVAAVSYQLQGEEHFTHPNSIGSKDHFIPENIRHACRTAPGKNVNGGPMEMEELGINLRDKAQQAVRAGVVDVLNEFYSLNARELSNGGAKSGVSSALVKELSSFAGVFKRDALSNKGKLWKYKASQDDPKQVTFNVDPGNHMWKALVEILRVMSLQMNSASAALAVPPDMNEEKVGDLVEAMIGELMLRYPEGKYEQTFPYRAVWVLPKMSEATATDTAVLRFLALVAAAEDMATVRAPDNDTPHAWASAVLPPPSDSLIKLVDHRPPLGEGEKARSALKAFKKQKRQEAMQAKTKGLKGESSHPAAPTDASLPE